jgi:hypothetical protein
MAWRWSCEDIKNHHVGSFEISQRCREKLVLVDAITAILDCSSKQSPKDQELVLIARHRCGPKDLLCKRDQVRVTRQPGAELIRVAEPGRRQRRLRNHLILPAPLIGRSTDQVCSGRGKSCGCRIDSERASGTEDVTKDYGQQCATCAYGHLLRPPPLWQFTHVSSLAQAALG